jgi:hypothetical protein
MLTPTVHEQEFRPLSGRVRRSQYLVENRIVETAIGIAFTDDDPIMEEPFERSRIAKE